MSINLQSIPASIELPSSSYDRTQYIETELELTVFAGGKVRGKSLQLSFVNENGNNHAIQLRNVDTIKFIKILQEEFISNYKL